MNQKQLDPQFLAQKTWDLYQTHGVPIELSEDILEEAGLAMDRDHLNSLIEAHQKNSQTTSAGQFKSGLGTDSEKGKRLHTVTHILHHVLRSVYGDEVKQTGSAITDVKARFDFTNETKPTPEELEVIRSQVQSIIDQSLTMNKVETTEEKAREMGAIGLFGEKYGDSVTVYSLEDAQGNVHSREFCGGPHVSNSKEIGTFKIIKAKSVGAGVKRIEFDVE